MAVLARRNRLPAIVAVRRKQRESASSDATPAVTVARLPANPSGFSTD